MDYIKQNFVDGDVLFAHELNEMDEQIALNKEAINELYSQMDFSQYAKKTDLPDFTLFANKSEVISEIPEEFITESELNDKGYATKSFVTNKIAEAQIGGGDNGGDVNVDLSGFATKDDLNAVSILVGDTAVSDRITEAIDQLNKVYTQNEAPTDAQEGALWVDLDEEFINADGNYTEYDKEYIKELITTIMGDYATKNYVSAEIAKAQLDGDNSNIDLSGYATKDDLNKITLDSLGLTSIIPANVRYFGAKGDGITDDSEAIQRAFDSGLTVVFPTGKYKFSGINCNHSVDVIFENAEVVPDFYEGTNGVIRKLFTFTECEKVTVNGLRIIAEPTTSERKHKYLTESIAEFHSCENVQIKDWTVKNLVYWNRGNTPEELYNRKGVLFTAIDSKIEVVDCDFGNIAYEEWCWVTYKDNLQGSAAHFKKCYFHDSSLGLSCVGILAHTAEVVNCVFKNITYTGSVANLLSLYGNFSDNIILNCNVGGVCDFREGVWVFSTYAKIDNNRMINSTCNKFAAVSGKDVHITNNIVTAKVFNYSHNPLEKNILREDGEVTKIRYVIENNVAEALDTEAVNADDSFLFFRFSNFVEGLWNSSDSEILCRKNRFFSNKNGIKNPNLCVVDVGRLIMHDNILYLGNRSQDDESGYTSVQLSYVNVDGVDVDLVGNRIDMNTVNEAATDPTLIRIASGYKTVKMNAFYNSVRSNRLKPVIASGYISGTLSLDAQTNINITDASV